MHSVSAGFCAERARTCVDLDLKANAERYDILCCYVLATRKLLSCSRCVAARAGRSVYLCS